MNYPTSLDSFVDPTTNDFLNSPNHVQQHSDANGAIEALEAKLGIGSSVAASGKLLRGTGAGASAWDKDAPTGTIVGTTDSQTLTNKTLTSPTINTAIINNPTLNTNTISEFTGANGVTVDGLNIKDSKLNTNNSVVTANITDDAVTAAKIDWASTGANAGIWWEELGRSTLSVAGDTMSVTSIPARKYLYILVYAAATGGTINAQMQFNGDTGANYSSRSSLNGVGDGTGVSGTAVGLSATASAFTRFIELNIINVLAQEKLMTGHCIEQGAAGAGTAATRAELANKWANTAAQISRVDIINAGTGDFAIGSECIVMGHN